MGWFGKLFGGDVPAPEPSEAAPAPEPAPANPAPAQDDPYRGAAFVEVDPADEVVVVGKAMPIYHWQGRVLALEPNRRGPLPLRWVVYTGQTDHKLVLRKVTFGEGGYRIDWEHTTTFPKAVNGFVVRVGDRIVMPKPTGVIAIHLTTGRPCWELPHPAALQSQPRLDRAGNLVLVFADQSWMIVSVRDGATISEGVARNDRDVKAVSNGTVELGEYRQSKTSYGRTSVEVSGSQLRVRSGGAGTTDEPVAPTEGDYALDGEWEGGDWTALAGGKLAVELGRGFGQKKWAAVGLLDATSLEPLQLLELGEVTSDVRCWVIDELLVVDTDLPEKPDDVVFVIDPEIERVVAMFREDKADAFLFDRDGNKIWAKPL